MKILSISPGYVPAYQFGGVVAAVHGLNKALVAAGCSVTCFSSLCSIEDRRDQTMPVMVDGVEVWYFNYVKWLEGPNHWQFSLELWNALHQHIPQYDIIHINCIWSFPSSAAAHVCRKLNKPYVITLHGMLYPAVIKSKWLYKYPYFKMFTRRDIQHASLLHYTSEDEADKCREICGSIKKSCIIYNGIDSNDYRDLPSPLILRNKYAELKGKKVILILGRINWKKGFNLLIPAFARLHAADPSVHLLIVGNDERNYKQKVVELIIGAKLGVVDHADGTIKVDAANDVCITFTGILSGSNINEAYRGSDVLVLPSYSENFGMVVVEAMSCGVPVVVSDQTGIHREIIQWRAGIVTRTTASTIETALATVLSNPVLARENCNNAHAMVRNLFTWDIVVKAMMNQYQECIAAQKVSS